MYGNVERAGERNYIVVCDAIQNLSIAVHIGAFECLVTAMALYYDEMAFYVEKIFFRIAVCEDETELAREVRKAAD
ncbi:hypothetical protein PISMIDRAFT_10361 [Pisolithus microcarpus 441]|uniref:Uncharacterized protein n=1 Tax=Pisolithus microcarpus 441 TaxID=765257 RepID=A0A0C9ZPH0_9AGAM|nr:hypothetical protein PISMIDRAFT_10361 [Pisolithus microcarpus 441]